jgi:hypothetical protein
MAEETPNAFRLEEYKTLRAELDDQIKAMRQVEMYTVGAMTAVYAWLAANMRVVAPGSFPWWLPAPVVAFGFLKNRAFLGAIRRIAGQMYRIEEGLVVNGVHPLTWYHHITPPEKRQHRSQPRVFRDWLADCWREPSKLFDVYDYVVWPLLLVGAIAMPFLAAHYLPRS